MKHAWSGVLLISKNNEVIAMHRDDKPEIRDPGCYGIFGGAAEGDETPLQAAVREISEETNLNPQAKDFELFKTYIQERDYLDGPAELNIFFLRGVDVNSLETFEGQGIKLLTDAKDPKIAGDVKEAFVDWFEAHPHNAS